MLGELGLKSRWWPSSKFTKIAQKKFYFTTISLNFPQNCGHPIIVSNVPLDILLKKKFVDFFSYIKNTFFFLL